MNDSTKTIIKLLGVAAGAYLLYEFLHTSGLWAQLFGTAATNTFSNPQQLLAYCQANPMGTATYIDSTGKSSSAPCAQWLAANNSAAPATTTPPATTSTPPVSSQPVASVAPAAASTLVPRLQAAAIANAGLGKDLANVSQWNYLLTHEFPGTTGIDVTTPAGDNAVPAAQYVGYYLALGKNDPTLTTAGGGAGMSGYVVNENDPYAWMN